MTNVTAREGIVFCNTKGNKCVILKVDDVYCWVFSKTKDGFNCNHYYKSYIQRQLDRGNYFVICGCENWKQAIVSKEFNSENS